MLNLIKNEVFKMIFKKRLLIIFGILVVLIPIFVYGESHVMEKTKEKLSKRVGMTASADWKRLAEQQMIDMKTRLDSSYASDKDKSSLRIRIEQLKYCIDNNINPMDSSASKFTTNFIEQSIFMFLPLLIILLTGDIVSGEAANGTIKLLLTRNVPRWKILLSKYLTVLIFNILVLIMIAGISVAVSGMFFGYGGWMLPVATGFRVVGGKLDTLGVINVPQWQYMLMVYGLAYFVTIVIGSISLMMSVLFRSTSSSIGIMMASLIGGGSISYFISEWKITRYFYVVNLQLTDYLTGSFQPVEGINMAFSVTVLAVWAIAALVISFMRFTRQDILV